jgi:tetratricopeptide (TPR) repeat protein
MFFMSKKYDKNYKDPQKIIIDIVQNEGEDIIQDPQRFIAFFNDYRKGQFVKELNLIKQTFSERIPQEMLEKKNQIPFDIHYPQLVKKLHETLGMQEQLAGWVVQSWALALKPADQELSSLKKQWHRKTDEASKKISTNKKTPKQQTTPQQSDGKKTFSLSISSEPLGATIYLGRTRIGTTPLITSVVQGKQVFRCSLDGYEKMKKEVLVDSDASIEFELQKIQTSNHTVTVTTLPANAEIQLDGSYKGHSPLTIPDVVEGNYLITCLLPGYEDLRRKIFVSNDLNLDYKLTATKTTPATSAAFSVTSTPPGAAISLDGKPIGNTPLTISLPLGFYDLKCSMNGYEEVIRKIKIPDNTSSHFNLITGNKKPQPAHAPLFVTSNPSGAEIYLDGKKVGTTPYDIPKVPVGSHNLLLYLAGCDPAKRTVEVPRDRNVSSNLKPKISSGGSNPIQNSVQNSPAAPSQKASVKNKGLYYWLLFSIGLLVAGVIISGMLSGIYAAPKTVSDVSDNPAIAVVPPVVNQTDTMSLQSGISLLNGGNYAEALKEFESVIASNPQSAAAWNYKSFSLFKLGRYNESIQASDAAIALDQNYTAAWTTKGYNLNLLERYNEAIPAFDHAIILNPDNADPWFGKGISYFSLHNYSAAVVSFDRAIAIAPTDKNAWNYKGKSLQALNNYSDAVAAYDSSLKINPGDVQILLNKGDCLNALKDYQNASSVFNSVLTNDPKNKRAITGVGTSFLNQGKYQDALASFNNALSIDPNYVDALVGKSRSLLNLKNSFDSLQIANKALEIDPQNSAAWICKADTWAMQSKYSDALQAYDQALKITPNSLDALMGKADVLVKVEDYNGAISILEKALAISPNNKDLWNEKGYALMKKGENSNADIALNKAIELDPKFVQAWSNKGYALSGAGSYNQSIQAFDKAIELNPNFKDAWLGKSIVYTKIGDFKASEVAAQQAMLIKQ